MGSATKSRSATAIVIAAIILGVLFDLSIYGKAPGVGVTIFAWGILAGYLLLSLYLKWPIRRDVLALIALIAFFSGLVAIRANMLLMTLNVVGSALLMLLAAEVSARRSLLKFRPIDYIKLFFPPFLYIDSLASIVSGCASLIRTKNSLRTKSIIKGIAITIPIIALFVILLSSADPNFGSYVNRVFNINLSEDVVFRILFATAIAVVVTAAYGYSFTRRIEPEEANVRASAVGGVETGILLGSINVLFLIFLILQATYLFGGESNVTVSGLTYAELARRGFFELIGVSAFSYLILLAIELYIEKSQGAHTKQFRILSTLLVAQVAVLMISSFMKLSLYEEVFGFTTLRLYSHAFILLLGVFFTSLLYKIHWDQNEEAFAFRTFASVVIFVATMNLFNPDAFIAQKNIDRYIDTDKLDTEYMKMLSVDSVPTISRALAALREDQRGALREVLDERKQALAERPNFWQSWSLSLQNARATLGL